jgi:hypothetical protein
MIFNSCSCHSILQFFRAYPVDYLKSPTSETRSHWWDIQWSGRCVRSPYRHWSNFINIIRLNAFFFKNFITKWCLIFSKFMIYTTRSQTIIYNSYIKQYNSLTNAQTTLISWLLLKCYLTHSSSQQKKFNSFSSFYAISSAYEIYWSPLEDFETFST